MSVPSQPPPGKSLLAQHLGSEQAAEEERRRIRQRQRADELHYRAASQRETSPPPDHTDMQRLMHVALAQLVRAEAERLRAEIPEIVRAEVRRLVAQELPGAVDYVIRRKAATHV